MQVGKGGKMLDCHLVWVLLRPTSPWWCQELSCWNCTSSAE